MATFDVHLLSDKLKVTGVSRTYTREYRVTTEKATSLIDLYNLSGIPTYGNSHPDDEGAFVTDVEFGKTQDDRIKNNGSSGYSSVVTVTYSNNTASLEAFSSVSDKKPWKLGAYNVFEEPLPYTKQLQYHHGETGDYNNKLPVVNTIGDPFYVEGVFYNTTVSFTYDIREFKEYWATLFMGSVNNEALTVAGYPIKKGHGRIRKLNRKIAYTDNGTQYNTIETEIEIAVTQPVLYQNILNAGTKFIKSGTKRIAQFKDGVYDAFSTSDGNRDLTLDVTEPVPLTAAGTIIQDVGADYSQMHFVKIYDGFYASWRPLGIPGKVQER